MPTECCGGTPTEPRMTRTHVFKHSPSGQPIEVELDKVRSFQRDDQSFCTLIEYIDGNKVHVTETLDDVEAIVGAANITFIENKHSS